MKNTAPYPLLIEGFCENENTSNNSIVTVAGVPVSWTNALTQGRGDMILLDVIPTNSIALNLQSEGKFSVFIGSKQVLVNNEISRFFVQSYARSFELVQMRQPSGQTLKFNLLPVSTVGGVVHVYYENKFAIPSIIAARNTSRLKTKVITFNTSFAQGQRLAVSQQFTIPSGIGNVIAIEVNTYSNPGNSDVVSNSLLSIDIGGTEIFKDVSTNLFSLTSNRPGLIFPILIRRGETFRLRANTQFASTPGELLEVDVRLYFDDDVSGEAEYI